MWIKVESIVVVVVKCCSFKKCLAYIYFHSQLLMHLFDQEAEVQSEPETVYEI